MNYVINEINRLSEKFGEEFNWGTLSNGSTYVNELQKETDMSVYNEIKAIARSYSSDDVLFILDNNISQEKRVSSFHRVFRRNGSSRIYYEAIY